MSPIPIRTLNKLHHKRAEGGRINIWILTSENQGYNNNNVSTIQQPWQIIWVDTQSSILV